LNGHTEAASTRFILVVATVRIKPGRAADCEAALAEALPRIRAANTGILFYHAAKSRDEADTYQVVEAYSDQVAMDAHMASSHLREAMDRLKPLIVSVDVQVNDVIA
jgi:quinol monooxygenase YgiN